jgi:hypothetical protein
MRAVHAVAAVLVTAVMAAAAAIAVWLFGPVGLVGHEALGGNGPRARPAVAAISAAVVQPARGKGRAAPLLGADGTPQPALPHAVPADRRERTLAALYATRTQALALNDDLDGAVVWVDVPCCDEEPALPTVVERADGERSRRHLGLDAPVFVSGKNLQRAAWVADRLTDDGYMQVFLVTR